MIKNIETSSIWHGGDITREMYKEMQDSFIDAAEEIAAKAKALVPVGDLAAHRYPANTRLHLRDTIRAVGKKKHLGERFIRGLATGNYETALPGAWVFAGARDENVYWAHWVEFGTYESPGQPFLRPAADASFNTTLAHAERAGQRVINKRRRRARARRRRAANA